MDCLPAMIEHDPAPSFVGNDASNVFGICDYPDSRILDVGRGGNSAFAIFAMLKRNESAGRDTSIHRKDCDPARALSVIHHHVAHHGARYVAATESEGVRE